MSGNVIMPLDKKALQALQKALRIAIYTIQEDHGNWLTTNNAAKKQELEHMAILEFRITNAIKKVDRDHMG